MGIKEIEAWVVIPPGLSDCQPFRQSVLIEIVRLIKPGQRVMPQAVIDSRGKLLAARFQKDGQRVGTEAGERQNFAGIDRQPGAIRQGREPPGKNFRGRLRLDWQQYLRELVERQSVKRRLQSPGEIRDAGCSRSLFPGLR